MQLLLCRISGIGHLYCPSSWKGGARKSQLLLEWMKLRLVGRRKSTSCLPNAHCILSFRYIFAVLSWSSCYSVLVLFFLIRWWRTDSTPTNSIYNALYAPIAIISDYIVLWHLSILCWCYEEGQKSCNESKSVLHRKIFLWPLQLLSSGYL